MDEEENKMPEAEGKDCLGSMTRREFAIGSVAAIGALSLGEIKTGLAAGAPAISSEEIQLDISASVKQLMDDRHILEEDLKQVIENAERKGEKLYQPDTNYFLAKLRIGKSCFYAEYSPAEKGFHVYSAYAHRFTLEGE